ncbi:hypothetical protein TNCV_2371261 [Trichonephila clavipes]|nr:hypothetical protein TNCV_2371261 [Trichonephila clavipes]
MCQIEADEIHHGKGLECTPVVNRSLEHHEGDSTFRFPNFERKHPGDGRGLPIALPLPPTSREDSWP